MLLPVISIAIVSTDLEGSMVPIVLVVIAFYDAWLSTLGVA